MAVISLSSQEGKLLQGRTEVIAYTLDTSPWGGYTSGAATYLFDVTNAGQLDDVSSTNLTGSASVSNGVITSKAVTSLVPGNTYRLEFRWVYSGNTFEFSELIECPKVKRG